MTAVVNGQLFRGVLFAPVSNSHPKKLIADDDTHCSSSHSDDISRHSYFHIRVRE